MFAGRVADPGAVLAVVPHPGRDAQEKGTRPLFSLSSLASPACPRPSHLPALIFSLLPLFFSWTSHSGPSSEHRSLKASSQQEIPMPVGLDGKVHGEESQGRYRQTPTSQLYCEPTVCQAL